MQKRLFSELGLSEATLKAVAKLGFEETSPIQSAAIPVLMSGKDVVGQSMTGSGKTAAFAIPAIERIDDKTRTIEILVMTPTRELCVQVAEEFARLTAFRPKVHAVPIYGGASYDRQFQELRKGPQVVIGTPGRVIDHLQRNTLDLSSVKMVILDECDRMLDMGFREDIERILSATPKERQTVFFSATLPPAIKRLIEDFSREPQHIRIESAAMTVPTVEQIFFDVPPRAKLDALTRLIDMHDARLGIIFCNTQRTVDDIADALLARGYSADRLHGGISQVMRTRTMAKFKSSGFDLLVATDVAGRGIDVDDLDLVVNFDLPYDPEDYVHRIGRTGRAGRKGVALTLISGREVYRLQGVERFTKIRMKRGRVPTWDQVEEKRLSGVLDKVRALLESGAHTEQATYIDRLLDEGHNATDLAAALFQQLIISEGIEKEKKPLGQDPFASRDAPQSAPYIRPASAPAPAASSAPAAAAPPAATAPAPAVVAKKKVPEVPAAAPTVSSKEPPPTKQAPAKTTAAKTSQKMVIPEEKTKADKAVETVEMVNTIAEAVVPEVEIKKSSKPIKPMATATPTDDEEEEADEQDDDEDMEDAEDDEDEIHLAEGNESEDDDDELDEEDDEEDEDNEYEDGENAEVETKSKSDAKLPAKPKVRAESIVADGSAKALPPPAKGYRWVRINLGKDDGIKPRDIVDAIVEGSDFPAKAVGLIKLLPNESFVQVLNENASDIVDSLDGGDFEGKKVEARIATTGKAREDKSFDRGDRGAGGAERKPRSYSDKPRSFSDKPRPYGDKPRSFSDKPRPYGEKPRPYGDKPRPYGDRPQATGDKTRPYGDRPKPYGDRARPYGDGGAGGAGGGDVRRPAPYRDDADRPRRSGPSTGGKTYGKPTFGGKSGYGGAKTGPPRPPRKGPPRGGDRW